MKIRQPGSSVNWRGPTPIVTLYNNSALTVAALGVLFDGSPHIVAKDYPGMGGMRVLDGFRLGVVRTEGGHLDDGGLPLRG